MPPASRCNATEVRRGSREWTSAPDRKKFSRCSGRNAGMTSARYEFLFRDFANYCVREGVMRISGGGARGIPLLVPKGDAVRPATDGLRQALFSSLAERVVGARFLDLFAGS